MVDMYSARAACKVRRLYLLQCSTPDTISIYRTEVQGRLLFGHVETQLSESIGRVDPIIYYPRVVNVPPNNSQFATQQPK